MARNKYEIREICGDWALDIHWGKETITLFFNSRNNAELVKVVLEWEDAHPNAAVPYKPTLTPTNDPERAGLYGKYSVYKNKDGSQVTDCFVLRPDKDPAAVVALTAYATATDNAELAADIINWVGAERDELRPIEKLRKMYQKEKAVCHATQAELEQVRQERDAAIKDMCHIAEEIERCGLLLDGEDGNTVNCLKLGRCDVCKHGCYERGGCRFEWRGLENEQ